MSRHLRRSVFTSLIAIGSLTACQNPAPQPTAEEQVEETPEPKASKPIVTSNALVLGQKEKGRWGERPLDFHWKIKSDTIQLSVEIDTSETNLASLISTVEGQRQNVLTIPYDKLGVESGYQLEVLPGARLKALFFVDHDGGGKTYGLVLQWDEQTKQLTVVDKWTKDGLREVWKPNFNPKMVPGLPKVQGPLDKEIVRRVVRQHRRELMYCYERELEKNDSLEGALEFEFSIADHGGVVRARLLSSTMKSDAVGKCGVGKIRRWVFPEPKDGGKVIVTQTFNFSF